MTTALYRRYRPDSFADVIGQEHVTDPLRAALRSDRATHAYLFSGPRGCGKTTSARILARCLNCAQGPTDTPCGTCESCLELATGGPGSLDVVEIDAASHGGVDDARDLRERAVFAPARDRYKVFIIDEAHMVTTQGFNALLKLVEEPPAHVKFVFATTEPDKVIGTIRSRTHHYPFRLVPPATLTDYLAGLCEQEGIVVDSGVLPLVVRAGGGSVRDSLSVLDQLLAGAEDGRVPYPLAAALLGFTPSSLLDDAVAALAAGDGAGVFRVVENVVESGQDPRRFVEDLLDRLRDLIVLAASGEAADAVLRALPADELDRMRPQAAGLGAQRLSALADIVNTGLTEMVGATSPRLQLELILARALVALGAFGAVPAASGTVMPVAAPDIRADAGSRSPESSGAPSRPREQAATSPAAPREPSREPERSEAPERPSTRSSEPEPGTREHPAEPSRPTEPSPEPAQESGRAPEPEREPEPVQEREQPQQSEPPREEPPAAASAGVDGNELRRRWPEILDVVASLSRVAWMTAQPPHAQVSSVSADTLTLRFDNPGPANAFTSSGGPECVSRAVYETVGVRLEVVVDIGGPGGGGSGGGHSSPGGGSGSAEHAGGGRGAEGPGSRERAPERAAPRRQQAERDEPAAPSGEAAHARPEPVREEPSREAPAQSEPRREEPTRVEPRSEAVARALADWEGTPLPVREPSVENTTEPPRAEPTRAEPTSGSRDEDIPLPPEPSFEHEPPAPEEDRPSRIVALPAVGQPEDAGGRPAGRSLPPVIDLAARQRARETSPPAPAAAAGPAPWEDDDALDAEIASSVDVADGGALVGVALVAKMLGGVVIDEIVENPADGRR